MVSRPIVFTLVQQRLTFSGHESSMAMTVSDSVVAVLQACIGAATKVIKILCTLHDQDLIGPYLSRSHVCSIY
jgi:hypothetical protein